MPPWPAMRGFGEFANDRSLSSVDIELITAWIDGGSPRGAELSTGATGNVLQSARPQSRALTLHIPDHVATGDVIRFEVPTNQLRLGWVDAWEFDPANRAIVEEATVSIRGGPTIGSWVPPEGRIAFPDGVAARLAPGTVFLVEIRYRKSTEPEHDSDDLTLFLISHASHELLSRRMPCGETAFDRRIDLLAVKPISSAAGDAIELAVYNTDGGIHPLAVVRHFDPTYRPTYRFRQPVLINPGAIFAARSSGPSCAADVEYVNR